MDAFPFFLGTIAASSGYPNFLTKGGFLIFHCLCTKFFRILCFNIALQYINDWGGTFTGQIEWTNELSEQKHSNNFRIDLE